MIDKHQHRFYDFHSTGGYTVSGNRITENGVSVFSHVPCPHCGETRPLLRAYHLLYTWGLRLLPVGLTLYVMVFRLHLFDGSQYDASGQPINFSGAWYIKDALAFLIIWMAFMLAYWIIATPIKKIFEMID